MEQPECPSEVLRTASSNAVFITGSLRRVHTTENVCSNDRRRFALLTGQANSAFKAIDCSTGSRLGRRDVGVDSEKIGRVELRLKLAQLLIVVAKRSAHLFRQIIGSNMVKVDAAL